MKIELTKFINVSFEIKLIKQNYGSWIVDFILETEDENGEFKQFHLTGEELSDMIDGVLLEDGHKLGGVSINIVTESDYDNYAVMNFKEEKIEKYLINNYNNV